jgi:3-deoxy-D-manno-octulosonate 8-phosphate phosphatase (KDO 8-P phosphatase)
MQFVQSDAITKASTVRMLVLDIDGTMTDGGVYYSKDGEELKRFSVKDGMGITLLQRSGILCGIITSENSGIVTARANKLKIEHVVLGSRNKPQALRDMSASAGVPLDQIAYIGDDVNDVFAMQIAGLSVCVGDAVEAVREVSHIICSNPGGGGAVREIAEFILTCQGKPITLPEIW